jgi:hypothetical protein
MMLWVAHGAPCLIILQCYVWYAVQYHPVKSPRTIAVPCEWSTRPMLHCSGTTTACLHVLQAFDAPPTACLAGP